MHRIKPFSTANPAQIQGVLHKQRAQRLIPGKWRMIGLLSLAELLAMVVWFSATSVAGDLALVMNLDNGGAAWLTMTVQIGFVIGAFISAVFMLADRMSPRRLFVMSIFAAALATALIPVASDIPALVMILRLLTGAFLAGVYPVSMKIMATWTDHDRGLGIGLLVGALTLGSASPHLLNGVGLIGDWRTVIWGSALLAFIGGVVAWCFVQEGPYHSPYRKFSIGDIRHVLGNRGVILANLGYLGHMWEIYAMWAWLSLFLSSSFAQVGIAAHWASIVTFAAIGIGSIGSVLAGTLADRVGRTTVTTGAMLLSGMCALFIGQLWGGNVWLISAASLFWGFFVVADSAQFSALISELSVPQYVGTALTLQTSLGFLLTLFSIRLMPGCVAWFGWEWAFAVLAIGPAVGMVAMQRLRKE